MATQQSTFPQRPLHITSFEQQPAASPAPTHSQIRPCREILAISPADIAEDGRYLGLSTDGFRGDIQVAPKLGVVVVDGDFRCSGTLKIGAGTHLHVSGEVVFGGEIRGSGSLKATGRIEAHTIMLRGDLESVELWVKAQSLIRVGGTLRSNDGIDAGIGIIVDGDLRAKTGVEIQDGNLIVGGTVSVRFHVTANNVEVRGNLHCGALEAEGRVACGGDIRARESIRAGRSITAKGSISARWRIMAGLIHDFKVRPRDEEIVCVAITRGTLYAGTLRLKPSPQPL